MLSTRTVVGCAALAALAGAPEIAWADAGFSGDRAEQVVARAHTTAEFEAGIIALPNAPISPSHQGGSTPLGSIGKGDATLLTGIHLLYRVDRNWAFGAGALLGPRPTSDSNYNAASGLPRTHSRSYLWVGAEGRYIPVHYKWFEAWIGATAGGIIVADRFDNNGAPSVPPVIGSSEVTVSTEGFSAGGQVGVDWMFAERFVVGFAVRGDIWLLPGTQQCSAIGDCTTLTGPVTAFEGGLTIGYRLPL